MHKPMDGLNSAPWVRLGRSRSKWIVDARPIAPRNKSKYGYDLWSNGLAFEAFAIGRTHKLSVRAPGHSNGMWLLDFDTQGRMVNASFTGTNWMGVAVEVPTLTHGFRLLPYPNHRPEMHRLIGGTWIRGKWTDQYDSSDLLYRAEIVQFDDPFHQVAMAVLDGVVAFLAEATDNQEEGQPLLAQLRDLPILNSSELQAEARRLHGLVGVDEVIPVEPPELAFDHYHAIPLKVQGGCGGPCTFCDLYERKIRICSEDTVRGQIEGMAEYLGEELDHYLKVVLLEGDALAVPSEQLGRGLLYARERFELSKEPFAHAFAKASTVLGRSSSELRRLRDAGLRNVNIGVESGCQTLLDLVKRGQRVDDCHAAIRKLRDAGIAVSINVIAGIGGSTFHRRHLDETLEFLRNLPAGIAVFYALLAVNSEARYKRQRFTDVSEHEMAEQVASFKRAVGAKEYLFIPM